MRFSAFMFIRNGLRGGYTFMEAIENVLPFVDEFFILEGKSDDGTLEALEALAKLEPKIRIESKLPAYVGAPKDQRGILLGAAFEEARLKCRGDWLIEVQADTVFHPVTVLAARSFLERGDNAAKYDALEVLRRQYRWNWQEMYREDRLNLVFKKTSGVVAGDALNVSIKGRVSRKLAPLFARYPAADNAWVFFENIIGKAEGCREIWDTPATHGKAGEFPWYDQATGRSFGADSEAYLKSGALPPFWLKKTSPFAAALPANLLPHIGAEKYGIAPRFMAKSGLYDPTPAERARLAAEAKARTGFSRFLNWGRNR